MISTQHDNVEHDPTRGEPDEILRPMDPVIEAALTENYRAFLKFLARRLGDQSTAEDVLHSFCLRVARKSSGIKDSNSVVAWLYSVLRSVLVDHYRSEAVRQRGEAGYAQEQVLLGDDRVDLELEEAVCNCFRSLLPTLRPDYAEIIRRVDLSGEPRDKVAADIAITPTNARVRLHRARRALREAVIAFCGSCCELGFRDCDWQRAHDRADLTSSSEVVRP